MIVILNSLLEANTGPSRNANCPTPGRQFARRRSPPSEPVEQAVSSSARAAAPSSAAGIRGRPCHRSCGAWTGAWPRQQHPVWPSCRRRASCRVAAGMREALCSVIGNASMSARNRRPAGGAVLHDATTPVRPGRGARDAQSFSAWRSGPKCAFPRSRLGWHGCRAASQRSTRIASMDSIRRMAVTPERGSQCTPCRRRGDARDQARTRRSRSSIASRHTAMRRDRATVADEESAHVEVLHRLRPVISCLESGPCRPGADPRRTPSRRRSLHARIVGLCPRRCCTGQVLALSAAWR